ncbi:MAG: hypothetical protein HY287_14685 [Planctomycetes bacterium]|nr:hypothetical protein [Planctomycetota bacterium]MBI3835570.1 hypothetical protein [Planctomycetota bacterium]
MTPARRGGDLSLTWHFDPTLKLQFARDDTPAMSENLSQQIRDRLIRSINHGGGWGYGQGKPTAAEATALACIALRTEGSAEFARGLDWLACTQKSDGAIPVYAGMQGPCWTTALAALAWLNARARQTHYASNAERAANWLLKIQGTQFASNPKVYGHNTRLSGWPWVEGTHSWVEPTAYSILALRAAGHADHPRVREGVELLINRAISGGGWNYGNPQMFGASLRPFPASTGIALTALAAHRTDPCIREAVAYVAEALNEIRAPVSLSWGLIALTSCGCRPKQADDWLAESAEKLLTRPANPAHDALIILASMEHSVFSELEQSAHVSG